MVRLILIFLFCCFAYSAFAQQNITAGEYFWDTDPGTGNGFPMTAADGAFDQSIENILKNNANIPSTTGIHTFNVRVKDAANNWSATFKTIIDVQSSILSLRNIKVKAAEYFWDNDPGEGNGSPMIDFDGAFNESIETALSDSTSIPSTLGVHKFFVRVKDAENNWSTTFKTIINIQSSISVTRNIKVKAAEYFWDTDPGAGNGTAMVAFDGAFDESIEQVLNSSISIPASPGNHLFHVRVKDAANKWSTTFRTIINIQDSIVFIRNIKIKAAEYFWDTDPGVGNASPMIAFDGAFNESIEEVMKDSINIPSTIGIHKFFVRVKDVANHWSPTFKTIVEVLGNISTVRNIKVKAAEYFWDNDPGTGNAFPMIAFDGAFNESIEEVLTDTLHIPPTVGIHKFFVRAKDAANNWGPAFKAIFDIGPPHNLSMRNIKVTSGECFFDSDPGQGNATPLLAFDGNFDSSVEGITGGAIPSPVLAGVHVLYTRVRDAENNWSPAFGMVVNIDTSIFIIHITGESVRCENDLSGIAYTTALYPNNTYNWIATGGNVVSGQGTDSAIVNWNVTGPHELTLVECDTTSTFCDTSIFVFNTLPVYNINISASICSGDSVLAGGLFQTQPGIYYDYFSSSSGCDSTYITTVTVNPVFSNIYNVSICTGDSFYVAGAYQHTPGSYVDTLATIYGCDSVIKVNLSVVNSLTYASNAIICNGDSMLFAGTYYSQAGSYSTTYTLPSGCDSIVVLNLNLNPTYMDTVDINIISGDSIFAGGAWQTVAGTYYDSLSTADGCDSIIITHLSVFIGIEILNNTDLVSVFPNPFDKQIEINSDLPGILSLEIGLFDTNGKLVEFWKKVNYKKHIILRPKDFSPGTYMLKVKAGDNILRKVIIRSN